MKNGLSIEIHEKKYGSTTILQDIQLHLLPTTIYGLVGKNGAGKTTLFECICRLTSFKGTITHPLEQPIKDCIGYLPADPFFIPRITAEEYIHFCFHARKKKVPHIEQKNLFDLPLKQYASTFSTGMKKKLAFWTLLLLENEYLILDEPFNGLDVETSMMFSHLLDAQRKQGKTILLASHILSSLTDIASEIYVLEKGRISKTYSVAEFDLLKQDLLAGIKKTIE